jgi:hypothetical protein
VLTVRGGVVNDPDTPVPVMPLGEEEHEVLLDDDQAMTEFAPDATKEGVAETNTVIGTAAEPA